MWRLVLALALIVGLGTGGKLALAADSAVTVAPAAAPEAEPPPPPTDTKPLAKPLKPAPQVAYGCKRIWRCDAQVCEWRRGCWGVYGYMEGPYFSQELAKRQWERDGWPTPSGGVARSRAAAEPALK